MRDIEIIQPPVRFKETQSLISEIENKLQMPVVVYLNSFSGNVCQNDVHGFYNLFRTIGKQEKIALFIKSDGGDVEAALRIVNIIRSYAEHITAIIPLNAASSATLIALGADEIIMGPLAYLTPIDSSYRHDLSPIDHINNRKVSVSNDEVHRINKLWRDSSSDNSKHHYEELYKYIHPLVLASLDRSSSLSIKVGKEILSYHNDDIEKCEEISNALNNDFPSHSYPIMQKEAKRIGLNVSVMDDEVHSLLLELNDWYSEMGSKAFTDYDDFNYHDNQISNILEVRGTQLYYQNDKDWSYIKEERRWQVNNDNSYWYRNIFDDSDEIIKQKVFIS